LYIVLQNFAFVYLKKYSNFVDIRYKLTKFAFVDRATNFDNNLFISQFCGGQ